MKNLEYSLLTTCFLNNSRTLASLGSFCVTVLSPRHAICWEFFLDPRSRFHGAVSLVTFYVRMFCYATSSFEIFENSLKSVSLVEDSWSADRSADIFEFGFDRSGVWIHLFIRFYFMADKNRNELEVARTKTCETTWHHVIPLGVILKLWIQINNESNLENLEKYGKKAKIITFSKFWNIWNEITRLDVI